MSVPEDSQAREPRVGGWLPTQRTGPQPPDWPINDETMLLPAFVTGTGPSTGGTPAARIADTSSSSHVEDESSGAHAAPTTGVPSARATEVGAGPARAVRAADFDDIHGSGIDSTGAGNNIDSTGTGSYVDDNYFGRSKADHSKGGRSRANHSKADGSKADGSKADRSKADRDKVSRDNIDRHIGDDNISGNNIGHSNISHDNVDHDNVGHDIGDDNIDENDIDDRLPSSDRNMLIFVVSLLAAGTLAVVTMMALSTHKQVAKHPTGTSPSVAITPSLAGHAFAGRPNLSKYCDSVAHHATPSPPRTKSAKWTCVRSGQRKPVTFTPADVCRTQFGAKTIAMYDRLDDATTWRCYR